jgi:Tol biopolymer transport system component
MEPLAAWLQTGATMNKAGIWIAFFSVLLCAGCSRHPGGAGGFKIAFVPSMPGGQYGIFSMNSDATSSKNLITDKMAQVRFASWSPDGKKLAFYNVRGQDADILKKYQMINENLLYVMDATGENQKRLLDFPVMDFGWAPDSRRLFFISAYESPDRNSPEVLNGTNRPLAYVYVFDTQTGSMNRLPGAGRNCSAAWSPDGTRLAAGFGIGEYCGIYLISPDGSRSERLTDGTTIDFRPAWSPDGRTIAYVAHTKPDAEDKDSGVFVIAADGTGKRHLVSETVSYIQWSLDGRMLLLQSANTALLIDPNGPRQVLLSAGAGLRNIVNAVFTPDGRNVMFCSNDLGTWKIYSIDLDGRNRKTITVRTNASNFCLSPLLMRH